MPFSRIVFALSCWIFPIHAAEIEFPVRLQLPVVTVHSVSGEEKKWEVELGGDFSLNSGKPTLKNVRFFSPTPEGLTFTSSVLREMQWLLMEATSFELATTLFQAQMEFEGKQEKGSFVDRNVTFTERQFALWDVPLKFTGQEASVRLASMRFFRSESGAVERVVVLSKSEKEFDIADLEPQLESLNPWDALGWILAGKKAKVGTVRMKDGGTTAKVIDLSAPGFQQRMKDDADRVLLRDRLVFRTKAEAKVEKEKEDEAIAKGCAGVAGCGCAIAAAAGGAGLAAAYWVLSTLF